MSNFARRTGVGVAALAALSFFFASPASADEPTSTPSTPAFACLDDEDSYGVAGVCQLVVLKADAACVGDLPYLTYELEAQGTPNQTATLVWGDPNGTHYVMSNLPLSGSVLWPGAVKGPDGKAADWPGWNLVDGEWVAGDEWNWLRPNVPVTFGVDPTSATITAQYPEAAPCADPPSDETQVLATGDSDGTAVLAATGSDARPLLIGAGALMLAGGAFLAVHATLRRRRMGL